MPKNQFQRPLPVNHTHQVPRHGKAPPPVVKPGGKPPLKTPAATLPPLAALLDKTPPK
ncbi:hypothetical protein [Devosia sp. CAU 1758]